jgi:hypothetical protein
MDAMTLCLALALAPLLPPDGDASGWHLLHGPETFDEGFLRVPPDRWWWDARLQVWRGDPVASEAETPEQMACEFRTYAAPAGEASRATRAP